MLLAQTPPPLPTVVKVPATTECITDIANRALAGILEVAGILAVIAFIVTGVLYLLSFGNEQKMVQAKKNFIWAVIGVVLISLMLGLIGVVRSLTGAAPADSQQTKCQTQPTGVTN